MTDDKNDRPEACKGQELPGALVLRPARLHSGGQSVDCEILNISAEGVKVRLPPGFEPTGRLTLAVESCGEYACRLVRRDGDTLSLEYPDQNDATLGLYEALRADSEGPSGARKAIRIQVLWREGPRLQSLGHSLAGNAKDRPFRQVHLRSRVARRRPPGASVSCRP